MFQQKDIFCNQQCLPHRQHITHTLD